MVPIFHVFDFNEKQSLRAKSAVLKNVTERNLKLKSAKNDDFKKFKSTLQN